MIDFVVTFAAAAFLEGGFFFFFAVCANAAWSVPTTDARKVKLETRATSANEHRDIMSHSLLRITFAWHSGACRCGAGTSVCVGVCTKNRVKCGDRARALGRGAPAFQTLARESRVNPFRP